MIDVINQDIFSSTSNTGFSYRTFDDGVSSTNVPIFTYPNAIANILDQNGVSSAKNTSCSYRLLVTVYHDKILHPDIPIFSHRSFNKELTSSTVLRFAYRNAISNILNQDRIPSTKNAITCHRFLTTVHHDEILHPYVPISTHRTFDDRMTFTTVPLSTQLIPAMSNMKTTKSP